jgi:hypothetical protein
MRRYPDAFTSDDENFLNMKCKIASMQLNGLYQQPSSPSNPDGVRIASIDDQSLSSSNNDPVAGVLVPSEADIGM